MERELIYLQMEMFILVNTSMGNHMVMDNINGIMVAFIVESLQMV